MCHDLALVLWGDWLQSLFRAGVSRFSAGGVGGWLQSHFRAGVSQFSAGGLRGWLQSLFRAGVSRFSAGGACAMAGVLVRRVSIICHTAASQLQNSNLSKC